MKNTPQDGLPRRKVMAGLPRQRAGQVLIEALVAVSVMTVGFLSVVGLLTRSLGLNRIITDNYTATYLAAEGVEVAKNILDGNLLQARLPWNSGFNDGCFEVVYDGTNWRRSLGGCASVRDVIDNADHMTFESGRYGYGGSQITPFRRVVQVTLVNSDEIKINSVVSWVGRGGAEFQVDLEDHFYNWRS